MVCMHCPPHTSKLFKPELMENRAGGEERPTRTAFDFSQATLRAPLVNRVWLWAWQARTGKQEEEKERFRERE